MQASTPMLLATDRQQSPLAVQEGASRRQLAHGPYGSRPAAAIHAGYTGQFREAQDWYLLGNGHRLYNPALMRFHSADRLSPFERGGLNTYAYCQGDPVNHTDPSGRFIVDPSLSPVFSLFLHSGLLLNTLSIMVFKNQGPLMQLLNGGSLVGSSLSVTGNASALGGLEGLQDISQLGLLISGMVAYSRFGVNMKDAYKARRSPAPVKAPVAGSSVASVAGTPGPTPRPSVDRDISLRVRIFDSGRPPRSGSLSARASFTDESSRRRASSASLALRNQNVRRPSYQDSTYL